MRTLVSAALGAALIFAVTAQSPAPSTHKVPMQFRLAEQNNSAEQGTATVLQGVNGVIVKLRLSGDPEGVDQPAHIHKGTCAKLDPKPAWGLNMVKNGTSETTVSGVTMAELQKGDYAINVHKSGKEIPVYVSCGNIPKK